MLLGQRIERVELLWKHTVDAVFANMYLHHATTPAQAIAEMVRVLNPGGRLVTTDTDRHDHLVARGARTRRLKLPRLQGAEGLPGAPLGCDLARRHRGAVRYRPASPAPPPRAWIPP